MPITQIKDEDRFPIPSLNEGALIYINSNSKSFHNKLGLAYGYHGQNLSARWSQDFYIYHNGYFNEQAPTLKSGVYVKDDWKLPKPAGKGFSYASGSADVEELVKNLNYFIENYEVVRIFDDSLRCLSTLRNSLMSLKDSKNPAYMKPIYVHFLGSGVGDVFDEHGIRVGESSLGIDDYEARHIEDWCESMSYQGFNIHVKYHYMETLQIMSSEQFYVFRESPTVPGPYPKKFGTRYY